MNTRIQFLSFINLVVFFTYIIQTSGQRSNSDVIVYTFCRKRGSIPGNSCSCAGERQNLNVLDRSWN